MASSLIFRQLYESESSTYTYLLGDPESKEAVLIDPVDVCVERDLTLTQELGLRLCYAINTHVHADHVTGTGIIKQRVQGCQSVMSKESGGKSDKYVDEGDAILIGTSGAQLRVRMTPGHTNGCMSLVLEGCDHLKCVFTGDALLIRGCGRTDFQQGNASNLYRSVQKQLFSLPDATIVYPAHDYKGRLVSTIGEEKKFNPRLAKSHDQFVDIMKNLNLPYPKKIDVAVPANMRCGLFDDEE